MAIDNEKLQGLMAEESFADKWNEAQNKEDILALLKENGMEVTEAELDAFLDSIPMAEDGELSDESLEGVAGGASIRFVPIIIKLMGSICPRCKMPIGIAGKLFGHVCRRWR